MKLNGIDLASYSLGDMEADIWLIGTTIAAAASLSAPYVVTEDDGETEVIRFDGYATNLVSKDDDLVRLNIVLSVEPQAEEAIKGIISNVNSIEKKLGSFDASMVEQIGSLASIQVMAMDLTGYNATQVASFRDYWPEWAEGVSYKQNDCIRYDGKYWRVSQDTTSQGIYPPGKSESLYYEVELAPDGIIVYRTCHGAYDEVKAGEKRHYPDAEGPVYQAKVDTAYDPVTVPDNWQLVEGDEQ